MNEKLSITLPAEIIAEINQQVELGRYASTSDVLEDATASWTRGESMVAAVRAKIQASLDDPRPSISIEDAFDRLHRRIEERMKSH